MMNQERYQSKNGYDYFNAKVQGCQTYANSTIELNDLPDEFLPRIRDAYNESFSILNIKWTDGNMLCWYVESIQNAFIIKPVAKSFEGIGRSAPIFTKSIKI